MDEKKTMKVFPVVIGKHAATLDSTMQVFRGLQEAIVRTRSEALSAYEYLQVHGHLPEAISHSAAVLLNSVMAEEHRFDFQCLLDEFKTCVVCKAFHTEPCDVCSKRAYHSFPCVPLRDQGFWKVGT